MPVNRRTFLGFAFTAAGVATLPSPLLQLTTTPPATSGNADVSVWLADGGKLIFPNVPLTLGYGAKLYMPDCFVDARPDDYTATKLTATFKYASVMRTVEFPFAPILIVKGNTLTFSDLKVNIA